jgi:type IV fimbrial biogenesis protein FimT
MARHTPRRHRGFTLIELMIVIALVAVIAALAAPSFGDMIKMQRLRGISSQLATDLSFARSEAVSRGSYVQVRVQSDTVMSCYTINGYSGTSPTTVQCDCMQPAGSRCPGSDSTEIKTVQVPASESVKFATGTFQPSVLTFNPRDGNMYVSPNNEDMNMTRFRVDTEIDSARRIRAQVKQSGRAETCAPSGSTIKMPTCSTP